MSQGFNWLVRGAVLSEADRIVGGNPDNLVAGESGETDGASSVRDEVLFPVVSVLATAKFLVTYQKGSNVWHNSSVSGQPIGNGTHSVFANTIPDVGTAVVSQTGAGVLKLLVALNPRQVTASQISGAAHQIWDPGVDGSQHDLGQFTGSLSRIGGCVHGK